MSKENAIIKDGILYEVMEGSCLSCDMSKHCVKSPHKPCKVFGNNVRLVIQREYMHLYICLSEEIIKTPEYDKEDELVCIYDFDYGIVDGEENSCDIAKYENLKADYDNLAATIIGNAEL